MEVTNRFKGLDLTDCLKNYGWRFITLYRRGVNKTILKKKTCKKAKWVSEEALQIEKRSERQKRKGKIYPSECRVPKKGKER